MFPSGVKKLFAVGCGNGALVRIKIKRTFIDLAGDIAQITPTAEPADPYDTRYSNNPIILPQDRHHDGCGHRDYRKEQDEQVSKGQADITDQSFSPGLPQRVGG